MKVDWENIGIKKMAAMISGHLKKNGHIFIPEAKEWAYPASAMDRKLLPYLGGRETANVNITLDVLAGKLDRRRAWCA